MITITIDIPETANGKLAALGTDAEKAGRYVLSVLLDAASRADSDATGVQES